MREEHSAGSINYTFDECPKRAYWFFETRYWLRDLILAALSAFIVISFFYQPVEVEGTSMLPRLENHDCIFINKIIYRVAPVRRGDIIVFHYPLDPAKSFIKRVVGLPGDWVAIKDGRVYINGKRLNEPYIPAAYLGHDDCPRVHVAPNHYYVLGDHRGYSDDSRTWGALPRRYIYGKAAFIYWPLNQVGALN
jgi:signal peptidase I